MPVDNRGFIRRYIPLEEQRGPIHDFIFQLYHGPLGYSFRRYTPSLEFFAIMGGIYYNFGMSFPSWLSMFGLLVLAYVRNQLREIAKKDPTLFRYSWKVCGKLPVRIFSISSLHSHQRPRNGCTAKLIMLGKHGPPRSKYFSRRAVHFSSQHVPRGG